MPTLYSSRSHRTRSVRALQARLAVSEQALRSCQRELAALQRLTALVLHTQPLHEVLEAMAQELGAATGLPIVVIERYDEAYQELECVAATGVTLPGDLVGDRFPAAQSLAGRVARSGQALSATQDQLLEGAAALRRLGAQTLVCLPLVVAEHVMTPASARRAIGTLTLAHPDAVSLDADRVAMAQRLLPPITAVVARSPVAEQPRRAILDQLATGVFPIDNAISARRQAETALHESERSLQSFLDNSPDTIFVLDFVTHTSRFLNRDTFLGYSRRELEQEGLIQAAVHPDDRPAVAAQWQQLTTMSAHQLPSIDYRVRRRQGDWEWLQQRVTVLSRTDQGAPHKLLITLSVISEHRRAEALVATQRDLAQLLATTSDPAVVWPRCLALAVQVCELDCGGLYLFDTAAQVLELVAHQGVTEAFVQATAHHPIDAPDVQLLLAGEAVHLSGADLRQRAVFRLETLSCIVVMPIIAQGQVLGCLNLGSHTLPVVPTFASRALETIATEIGNIVVARRTMTALRLSEEYYRGLMESLGSMVFTLDATGTLQYVNQLAAQQLGGAPQDLVGKRIDALLPAAVVSMHIGALRQVFNDGTVVVHEDHVPVAGQLRWHRISFRPIHGEQGQVLVALVNATDIHDLKTTQEELRTLNQTLEARVAQRTAEVQDLYDHAPVGYHSLDRDGKLLHINQTEIDWLGYAREELLGRPLSALMTPASQARVPAHFARLLAQGWLRDFEVELIRKDGSTFPALINATAIYDAAGAFVMTRSTLTDLTLRKQAEAALRASEEQLRLSEARLHLLLDKTPAVIFSSLAEPDFRTTFISESVRAVLGYTPDQFLASPGFWASRIHPEDRAGVFGDAPQLRQQGWRQYEYRCRHADGSYRWVESGVSLLPAMEGRPAEVVGYMIDITARKEAEELLRQANLDLARAARLKDEFLANMSHELRTPLNAILGFSEGLQATIYEPLTARQQRAIQHIETSGRHLLALINDILDLAKVEAGQLTLARVRFEIADVCQASLLFVKELAHKKALQLSLTLHDPRAMIEADPRRLKQMLINLLANAVKFTPDGGQVRLEVTYDTAEGMVHFAVCDTGIGIPPEEQARLFQPFVQLDSGLSRQHEGSGLGLALVRRLAELHGGSVTLKSAVGAGSCFTLILPEAPPTPEPLSLAAPTELSGASQPSLARMEPPHAPAPGSVHILLVEDNEPNIQVTSDYLQARGFAVSVARTGREALTVAVAQPPDLILMDIQLPELDGMEVLRQLRALPPFARTPIIALTALAMPGDRERCLAAGASAYLAKPVRFRELLATIHRLLQP